MANVHGNVYGNKYCYSMLLNVGCHCGLVWCKQVRTAVLDYFKEVFVVSENQAWNALIGFIYQTWLQAAEPIG